MDETALSASIFDSLRKCVELREKYTAIGLQRKTDNPRDYPDLSVASSPILTALKVSKVSKYICTCYLHLSTINLSPSLSISLYLLLHLLLHLSLSTSPSLSPSPSPPISLGRLSNDGKWSLSNIPK